MEASHDKVEVVETEHLWIPMADGTRLAARMWQPVDAAQRPGPALFEYIPYRKADMVRARDARNHPFFAAHGYTCLRVDMRGSGDSDGVMADMYAPAELDDARQVIAWIAAQPWCDGAVGMFGTSWGGTAALQANVGAPAALKAVIAVCATHDRYADDIHHMGGCLLTDTFEWGATLPAILAAPPTPAIGPDWETRWRARLAQLTSPVEHWVREEAPAPYWHHGSVTHAAERLSRPVLAIGGWSDRYSNSVMGLTAARPDLVTGIVGPWGHHYPDQGHPRPGMSFQDVALGWWDRWLRGDDAAWDRPALTTWVRAFDAPADAIDTRAGQWMEVADPASATQPLNLYATDKGLAPAPGAYTAAGLPADLLGAAAAGDTGYFGRFGGLPLDQAAKDAVALTYDSDPLDTEFTVYGSATATLDFGPQARRGQVFLRLCDVAPDGRSALICHTPYNLALTRGAGPHKVAFPTTAYRLQPGHRLRIALAAGGWPLIWPAASATPLRLTALSLTLPHATALCTLDQPLPAPRDLPAVKTWTVLSSPALTRVETTAPGGTVTSGWEQPLSALHHTDTDHGFAFTTRAEHAITPGDPESARSTFTHCATYTRPEGRAEIRSTLTARASAASYEIDHRLTVHWNGEEIAAHHWTHSIPRQFG